MAATRKQHSSQPTPAPAAPERAPVLYLAFELGWNEWKLAFATGPADHPRLRSVGARNLTALEEKRGRSSFSADRIKKRAASPGMWVLLKKNSFSSPHAGPGGGFGGPSGRASRTWVTPPAKCSMILSPCRSTLTGVPDWTCSIHAMLRRWASAPSASTKPGCEMCSRKIRKFTA
jgi:hypothetical protein